MVSLYDNLTTAQGKKGDVFVSTKKEGLQLLKEAEKCYQVRVGCSGVLSAVVMATTFIIVRLS